jgi:hypothetical protein
MALFNRVFEKYFNFIPLPQSGGYSVLCSSRGGHSNSKANSKATAPSVTITVTATLPQRGIKPDTPMVRGIRNNSALKR